MNQENRDIPAGVRDAETVPSEDGNSPGTGPAETPVEPSRAESAPAPETLQSPLAENWQDRFLRLAAEFDNFRKRSARDYTELVRNAERDLIAELTEVLDSFGRALNTNHQGEGVTDFAKGVSLIRDQLFTALTRRGLERMQTVGSPFDPALHEALMQMPSEEHTAGIVVQEVSPGYLLGGRVLRHARVVVSNGKPGTVSTGSLGEQTCP